MDSNLNKGLNFFDKGLKLVGAPTVGYESVQQLQEFGKAPNDTQIGLMSDALGKAYATVAARPDNKILFERGTEQDQKKLANNLGNQVRSHLLHERAAIDGAANPDKKYALDDDSIKSMVKIAVDTFSVKDEKEKLSPFDKMKPAAAMLSIPAPRNNCRP